MFDKNPENINRNGRPKGSENKEKKAIKDFINDLIENNQNQILNDFANLEPKDRVKFFIDLLKYTIPIQKDSEISLNSKVNTDEVKRTITELIENHLK